jgi:acyl carrier protein
MNLSEYSTNVVSKSIVDVNAQKTDDQLLVDHPDTRLLGEDGVIDSLAFAYLIVCIEQYVLDDLDKEIVLFDDEVMQMDFDSKDNPFMTIGSLIAFVQRKLA